MTEDDPRDGESPAIDEAFAAMAGGRMNEQVTREILNLVVSMTQRAIRKADGAGVTLVTRGGHTTGADTGDWVLAVDAIQYGLGEGPCLWAIANGKAVYSSASDPRWTQFGEATEALGVTRVLSAPLMMYSRAVGALNVYARGSEGFDEPDQALALLFADELSAVLAGSEMSVATEEATSHLQEALRSREVIGQAIGIMIEREGLDAAEAFDFLRRASQNSDMKLREIARRIIGSRPGGRGDRTET